RFFFSSRRRHTRSKRDWSSDVCSSDLAPDVQTTLLLCAKVEVFIFGGGDGDASVFHFLDHGVDIIQFCLDASLVRSMQLQCRNTFDGSQVGPALRSAGDGNVV